nr:surface lipoprotein assembly modifier [Thalassobius sp. Cn5-15]
MGSKTSQTRIGLRYYGRRVHLSDEARDLAPTVSNSDLAFDYGEVSLAQLRQTATAQWRYGFALGQSWSGGERFQRSTRLNVSRSATLGALGRLRLGSQLERLSYSDNRPDVNGITLSSHLSRHSEDWGNWQFGLTLKRERSDNINADRKQVIAQIAWAPDVSALPVMSDLTPVVTLGGSKQRYDAYSAGFIVPGGRRDETVFGQLEATFTQFDYAGFAPTVTLRSRRTTSNVSRFETRETTLSLGVRSSF